MPSFLSTSQHEAVSQQFPRGVLPHGEEKVVLSPLIDYVLYPYPSRISESILFGKSETK